MLQVIGLAWWFGTILLGLVVDPISPFPAVLFWIELWVGLPIICVLFGNPWPALSPFRTLFAGLERGARLFGLDRLDAGLRYPAALGRWPATALLIGAVWAELILPDRTAPTTVAALLGGYTVFTLLGMMLFGRIAWLRNAELFEVYLGWFGRVGPWGDASSSSRPARDARRSATPGTASTARSVRSRPSPTSAGRSCVRGSPA